MKNFINSYYVYILISILILIGNYEAVFQVYGIVLDDQIFYKCSLEEDIPWSKCWNNSVQWMAFWINQELIIELYAWNQVVGRGFLLFVFMIPNACLLFYLYFRIF